LEKDIEKVPCDCILVKGEVLVDEDTITGEVVPVTKTEIAKSN